MGVNGSVSEVSMDTTEDSAEDADERAYRRPAASTVTASRKARRKVPLVLLGVVLIAAIGVVIAVLSSSSTPSKSKAKNPPKANPTFVTFNDRNAGFALNYPPSWNVDKSNDPDVPLQLSFGDAGLDTLLVRVTPLTAAVDTTTVANIKAVTDAILSGTPINVFEQKSVTINKIPGYYYLYTLPKDPGSGVTLIHSHFFLFPQPRQMVSLVFQAVDLAGFNRLAPTFDQVVASIQSTPTTP